METIQNLPAIERPREKMTLHGPSALTDAELLVILIGSGSRERPVLELCQDIIAALDNDIRSLLTYTFANLISIKGVGTAKASTILAALEIGKRCLARPAPRIKTQADAISAVRPHFTGITRQMFVIVLLNLHYELLATCEIGHSPQISQIMRLVTETGAERFGLISNGLVEMSGALIQDLEAAATMLNVKFHGMITIT